MNYVLDEPIVSGDVVVAALSKVAISSGHSNRHVSVSGMKYPLAILFQRGAQITAFDPSGISIDIEELEKNCPKAISEFRNSSP